MTAERRIHSSIAGLLVGAALQSATPAHAAEPVAGTAKYALNNLHDEMAQCYAFYLLAAEGVRARDPADATIGRLEETGNAIMRYMHGIQQMIGMSEEAGLARTRMRTTQQLNLIGGDYVNFAILLERYGEFCRLLADQPKKRALELKAMEEQRQQAMRR
jgi:hypothetical protein